MTWIQKVARHLPRKEDVVIALLKMLRERITHLEKKLGGIPSKKNERSGPCDTRALDDTRWH